MDRRSWISLALVLACSTYGTAAEPDGDKGDPRAAALLEEASKNRYTWSPDVVAVEGKFTRKEGDKTIEGTFRRAFRAAHGQLVITATDEDVKKAMRTHLSSLLNHRAPPAPGTPQRKPTPSVVVVEDEARGPLIMSLGDDLHSTHRVKDGKLVQVNRMMGGRRFTIDTTGYTKSPDGRFFPTNFTVTWWDAATGKRVEWQEYVTPGFHVLDGQLFPKAETIVTEKDGKKTTVEIQYSDIKFTREAKNPK